jgi:hypothetical protein
MTLRDALTRAASVAGVPPPRFEIPLGFIDALIRLDDALPYVNLSGNHMRALRHWQGYNTTKAVEKLGLTPRPFEITVQDALAWFKERGKL